MTSTDVMTTDERLAAVQRFVDPQPWGPSGNDPAPVEVLFDARAKNRWTVKFVVGVRGTRRVWAIAQGSTLDAALIAAQRIQERTT